METKTRPYKVSPSPQQTRLAKKIRYMAESGLRTTKMALLKSVDYSHATATGNAKSIMNTRGLKMALEAEGISIDNSDRVVKSILNVKVDEQAVTPDNQLRAADYVARRLGGYAPEKLEVRKVVAKIVFNKPQ